MNPPNSDYPLKPPSIDAQVSIHANSLDLRTPEALLGLKATVVEAAMDGMALLGKGQYLYLNSQYLKIFGYDNVRELEGQPWQVLYKPTEANRIEQQFIPALESVGYWRGEAIAQRKDESSVAVELSITQSEDEVLICVCRDISKQKRAELEQQRLIEQLSLDNAILQAQQNACSEGLLILDENCHILSSNPKFSQLWQIPPTLMNSNRGREVLKFVSDQLVSPRVLIEQVDRHQDRVIQAEIQLKDGRIFEWDCAPLYSKSGEYYGQTWSFQDISDRKNIEAELTFFKSMVECSGDAIAFANAQGEHAYQNQAFSQLFEAETVEDFNQAGGIPAAYANPQEFQDLYQRVIAGESWKGELVQRSCRGRLFNSVVRADSLKNRTGEIVGLIAITRDISDRIAIEDQLRVSQQRLSLLVQHTPLAVIEWDREFQVTAWNPAAEIIFGYTASEALGRNLEFLIPDFEQPNVDDVIADLLTQRNGTQHINQNLTKAGSLITCQWYNTALVSADGEFMGVASMAIDITEQERTQSELKRSQAQLQAILDNAPLAIYVKDLDGRYILINQAIEKQFQVKQADWLGKTTSELMPRVSSESIPDPDLQVLQQGQAIHVEEKVTVRGEERYFLSVKFPLMNENNQPDAICGISTDITEFKETEEELENQTNFLQSIWDNINYSIFILDVLNDGEDFRFASFNPAALRSSQQPLQGFIGQTVQQVFPEEMVKTFLPRYAEVVHSGESISFEEQFLTEYNSGWWFITLAPLKDAEGKVYQIVATSEDITERKRTEQALRVQQTQIKYLLNNIPHLAWLKNHQDQFIAVNQSLSFRFGLTPEQMIGKTSSDLPADPEFIHKLFKYDPQVMASRHNQRVERKLIDRFGQKSWLEIYNAPIIGDQNQTIGTVGIAVDITDRKLIEKNLKQQAQREKLLNQLTTQIRNSLDFDTILQTTLASVKYYLMVDRCGFLLYYPHLEKPYWEVIQDCHNDDLPDHKGQIFSATMTGPVTERALNAEAIRIDEASLETDRAFRQVLKITKTKSLVGIPLKRSSGQVGLLSCTIHQGQVRKWKDQEVSLLEAVVEQLAIALNQAELYQQTQTKAEELEQAMQELRRTQAQMIQTEKMSSLGQLVAGVAHEINNPVSFIYGNLVHAHDYANDLLRLVELYRRHYPNPVSEIEAELTTVDLEFVISDLPKLFDSMQNGAERIKKIVESLRTFSRLDEAELKTIDLHQGLDSALMIVESRLHKKMNRPAIEVIKEYGNIPRIECYAAHLNQVFFNILTNAIDALEDSLIKLTENRQTFDNPQIRICTELTPDHQLRIAIANNGLGMPAEVKEHIFDPFFTTKPVGKGTGMGLSICHQIITEKHSGSLECISHPEQGTEMIIYIPCQSETHPEKSSEN